MQLRGGCNGKQVWLAGTASAAGADWITAQGRVRRAMITQTPRPMAIGVAPVLGMAAMFDGLREAAAAHDTSELNDIATLS